MGEWTKPLTYEDRSAAENLALLAERVTAALDGCGYCQRGYCTARAHGDLKQALEALTGVPYRPKGDRDSEGGDPRDAGRANAAADRPRAGVEALVSTDEVRAASFWDTVAAAHAVVKSFGRLCRCTDEFLPDYPSACAEYEQAVWEAIIVLRRALGYPDRWTEILAKEDEKIIVRAEERSP